MSDSLLPMDGACQSPLSLGFSRREYWSGLPHPPPWDLPDQGIFLTQGLNPRSLHWQAGSLPLGPPGEPVVNPTAVKVNPSASPCEFPGERAQIWYLCVPQSAWCCPWHLAGSQQKCVELSLDCVLFPYSRCTFWVWSLPQDFPANTQLLAPESPCLNLPWSVRLGHLCLENSGLGCLRRQLPLSAAPFFLHHPAVSSTFWGTSLQRGHGL